MRVITHSGHFQPDDVFAVAALSLLLGDFELIRTRNPEIIKTGDYVVDVGGEYNPEAKRFDHHQVGGGGARENGVPYSSIGLVWKHYGEKLAGSIEAAKKIDEKLIQPIDAEDVGVTFFAPTILKSANGSTIGGQENGVGLVSSGIYPYRIDLALYAFNSTWKEGDNFDEGFNEAVKVAKKVLEREIIRTRDEIEARAKVLEIYQKTEDKRILIFDRSYPSYEVLKDYPEVLFIVKPEVQNASWKINTVSENREEFKNRKDLPAKWAGKTGEELAQITGVPDATFCHNGLFVAGATSMEGAIALARLALEPQVI